MIKEEIKELSMQNKAYKRKLKEDRNKIKIDDGCYVTFCWPPLGD